MGHFVVISKNTSYFRSSKLNLSETYEERLGDAGAPIKALKGFQKLSLKPGEIKRAVIALNSEAFEYYDEMIDELAVKPGKYQILYGTSSRDEDLQSLDFTIK